ncbi:MAG TPA: ABC transporter substrate-binding protein [Patescibacteria group bacterium]|nr:ABC transporter substrate-binding protein [Patescibacteria group bacterium]
MMLQYNHRPHYLLLFLLLILLSASGCNQPSSPTPSAPAKTGEANVLTIGSTMKMENINIDDYYFGIFRAIFTHQGLVKLSESGQFSGDMAQSWESEDGKTWNFSLRPGLTWHDGQPLTAADIKFTLEYHIAKSVEYRSHFALIESIEAPDEQSLIITLSQPNPRFLYNLLVLRVLPQHIFAAVDQPAAFNSPLAAIGCGPYVFHHFDAKGGLLTFIANPNYHRGPPVFPEVRIRLFKNPDTLQMALQKGDIDLTYTYSGGTDPVYAAALRQNPRIRLLQVPNLGVSKALIFNTSKTALADSRVRQALSYAINYDELIRLFAPVSGIIPTAGFIPPGTPGYTSTRPLSFSPEKAQQLLDLAGYTAIGDKIREKEGQSLAFEIIVRNDIAENIRIAELLQKYFRAVGVNMVIKLADSTLYRTISDRDKSYTSLLARTTPWGMMMWAGMGSGYMDGRNIGWAMVTDTAFQSLVDQMNRDRLPADYQQHAADLQLYYAENLPAIALYWDSFIQPTSVAITGWKINPLYGVLNEDSWYSIRRDPH